MHAIANACKPNLNDYSLQNNNNIPNPRPIYNSNYLTSTLNATRLN